MAAWSRSHIQPSTPLPATVSIKLPGADVAHLDKLAEAAGCLRHEMARRLIVAVIEDDRAAELEASGGRT